MDDIDIELSKREVEYLKSIHTATALREMMKHEGWQIVLQLVQDMIARWENQHLNFSAKASKEAYWASGLRLGAVREFATVLTEKIAQQIDILNQPLKLPKPYEVADLDSHYRSNGNED